MTFSFLLLQMECIFNSTVVFATVFLALLNISSAA